MLHGRFLMAFRRRFANRPTAAKSSAVRPSIGFPFLTHGRVDATAICAATSRRSLFCRSSSRKGAKNQRFAKPVRRSGLLMTDRHWVRLRQEQCSVVVIASEAKQSSAGGPPCVSLDCFVAPLLAMTVRAERGYRVGVRRGPRRMTFAPRSGARERCEASMMETAPPVSEATPLDAGLRALCGIAAYYRIGADPVQLARELALRDRGGRRIGSRRAARIVGTQGPAGRQGDCRAAGDPARSSDRADDSGALMVFGGRNPSGLCRLVDPISHAAHEAPIEDVARDIGGQALLIARRIGGAGVDPRRLACAGSCPPSGAIASRSRHVLIASLFVQIFALVTPLFFQVVVDKVLTHKGYSTLVVLVGGPRRSSACSTSRCNICAPMRCRTQPIGSTSNSVSGCSSICCGCRSPISRPAPTGQTVARVRELENDPHVPHRAGAVLGARSRCSPSSSSPSCSPIRGS